jgi:hypothetical protein
MLALLVVSARAMEDHEMTYWPARRGRPEPLDRGGGLRERGVAVRDTLPDLLLLLTLAATASRLLPNQCVPNQPLPVSSPFPSSSTYSFRISSFASR